MPVPIVHGTDAHLCEPAQATACRNARVDRAVYPRQQLMIARDLAWHDLAREYTMRANALGEWPIVADTGQ